MIVVDASVVVEALTLAGPYAPWAEAMLATHSILAPYHMPVEVASALRRLEYRGMISADVAAICMADLGSLTMQLFPFEPCSERVWELCRSVSAYDGWYIALAESLEVPLATLDRRLASAVGPRCGFELPPEG